MGTNASKIPSVRKVFDDPELKKGTAYLRTAACCDGKSEKPARLKKLRADQPKCTNAGEPRSVRSEGS